MANAPGPMLLAPLLKARAWGGRRLLSMGRTPPTGASGPWGESWELADLPPAVADGVSRIEAGAFAGATLREAMRADPLAIMGGALPAGEPRFPLLVKFLDAAENLSVQVHPDAAYAARHPEAHLKTEAWIVLDADPGAIVYRGLKPHVTRDAFERHLRDGSALQDLVTLPVRRGDCIPLQSGLCHALGGGILVAEVQTPSDTTFRVYDWDRNDPSRPLHLEAAMECLLFGDEQALGRDPITNAETLAPLTAGGMRTVRLCRTPYFEVEQIDAERQVVMDAVTDGGPVVWISLQGEVRFESPGPPVTLPPGRTVLLPAAAEGGRMAISRGARLLRVTLPHPFSRMLA